MGVVGGPLGYHLLRWISPPARHLAAEAPAEPPRPKVMACFGESVIGRLREKVVIDFGCGEGADAICLAQRGVARVIGVDIREDVLAVARRAAREAGVGNRCAFVQETDERGDVIFSIDAFEHFSDPRAILSCMADLLRPGGRAYIWFGPPWYHPRGGHLFSVFPWSHLLFTERALLRWRADFKSDGAKHFHEVAGGLNGMTVGRFRRLVQRSRFDIETFEAIPIRALRLLANRMTREFLTSAVRATLVLPARHDAT